MSIKKIYKNIGSFSLTGLIRYLALLLAGKDVLIEGKCVQCGSCCRTISLRADSGWIRHIKDFERVCDNYPEYRRFISEGKDKEGFIQFSCSWLTEQGVCKDYENRLKICRKFPSKSLHFCGGTLPTGCGYNLKTGTPFDKVLKKELKHSERQKTNTHP